MPSTTSASTRRQASNLASNSTRRVVITGIGLICSVGNTTGAVWQALLAGKSGVGRITGFDASAFASQIAAEVRNFDPFDFIEKKEVRIGPLHPLRHRRLRRSDEDVQAAGHSRKRRERRRACSASADST